MAAPFTQYDGTEHSIDLNDFNRRATALTSLAEGTPFNGMRLPGGRVVSRSRATRRRPENFDIFPARILDQDSHRHGFVEIEADAATEAAHPYHVEPSFHDMLDGRVETLSGNAARSMTGQMNVIDGTVVMMMAMEDLNRTTEEEYPSYRFWIIEASLDNGYENNNHLVLAVHNRDDSEHEAALGDEYQRESNTTDNYDTVGISFVSDVIYNPDGDQKLYVYHRFVKFPWNAVMTVGVEIRDVVDTPEDCT